MNTKLIAQLTLSQQALIKKIELFNSLYPIQLYSFKVGDIEYTESNFSEALSLPEGRYHLDVRQEIETGIYRMIVEAA